MLSDTIVVNIELGLWVATPSGVALNFSGVATCPKFLVALNFRLHYQLVLSELEVIGRKHQPKATKCLHCAKTTRAKQVKHESNQTKSCQLSKHQAHIVVRDNQIAAQRKIFQTYLDI